MALNISAGLQPTGGGAWETHDAQYGKGGWRAVADLTARDAISSLRRSEGMQAYVIATGATYRLGAGLTNGDWVLVSSGAITAGNGLTGTTTLSVLANGGSLEVSASGVRRAALSGAVSAAAGSNVTAFASGDFTALDITTTGNVLLGPAATRPSTGLFRIGGAWSMAAQNSAAASVGILTWDNATNILLVGGGVGAIKPRIQGSSNVELNIGGTTRLVLGAAAFLAFLPELGWDQTVALPVLDQQATGSATGQLMTIQAQNAAATGGALNVASGTGGTNPGEVSLSTGATKRFRADGTGIGFFATAPVAKQAVTGSRGGNAALASLLTALATTGLLTDSSTA